MFCSSDKFPKGILATKQDVIGRVLRQDHFFLINAARAVAAELVKYWIGSNVDPIHELTVAKMIFNMMTEFKPLEHYPKKKCSKPWCVAKESQFLSDVGKLYVIFCEDN